MRSAGRNVRRVQAAKWTPRQESGLRSTALVTTVPAVSSTLVRGLQVGAACLALLWAALLLFAALLELLDEAHPHRWLIVLTLALAAGAGAVVLTILAVRRTTPRASLTALFAVAAVDPGSWLVLHQK